VTHEEAMKRRVRHYQTDAAQFRPKLVERDVLARFPQSQDHLPILLDPARARVPALRLGCKVPGRAALRLPPDRCRRGNTKPVGRRTATHPRVNRAQQPRT
tara:strand:- start:2164 stop:2466 length:303 start_codon:yes stop_codon:yes gene_type:complete